jgi:hypothetical protein
MKTSRNTSAIAVEKPTAYQSGKINIGLDSGIVEVPVCNPPNGDRELVNYFQRLGL